PSSTWSPVRTTASPCMPIPRRTGGRRCSSASRPGSCGSSVAAAPGGSWQDSGLPMTANTGTVVVRRLMPHESGLYRSVRIDCLRQYPDVFGTTPEEEEARPVLPFERAIREQDPYQVMLGAFVDGRLSGLCGFSRETRKKTAHRAELVQMCVAPHASGGGV